MLIRDEHFKKVIMQALADDCSVRILKGTEDKARSAMELVRDHALPASTAYRRLDELSTAGLLRVERIVVTDDGKKYSLYRSTIKEIRVEYKAGQVEVNVSINEDVVDRFTRLWTSMSEHK